MNARSTAFIASSILLMLAGCRQPLGNECGTSASLRIAASSSGYDLSLRVRTIVPETPSPFRYRLYGSCTEENPLPLLATFTSLSDAEIAIQPGSWTFRLDAEDSGSNVLLSATKGPQSIGSSPTTLPFVLKPAASGSGSVDIAIYWPSQAHIASVETTITGPLPATTALKVQPALEIATSGSTSSISLARSGIDAGEYLIAFAFNDAAGTMIMSVMELARIAPALKSTANYTLATADFNTAPSTPGGLQSEYSSGDIALSWIDESSNETGFIVERSDDELTTWSRIAEPIAGATSAQDTDIPRGRTYVYRIMALNTFGDSPWSEIATVTVPYLVTFDSRGGSSVDALEAVAGQLVTLPASEPTRPGYDFHGWSENSDGSGTSYAAGASFTMPAADSTLYAQWAMASYSISYLGNCNTDGKAPTDSSTYFIGSTATVLVNSGGLWKSGYLFAGWNTNDDGSGTNYAVGNTITMDGSDLVLYARWVGSIDGAGLVVAKTPYFDALTGKIFNVYPSMEYSLDDGSTWSDCAGSEVSTSFSVENEVWVRIKSTPAQAWYLGQVSAGSDSADLIANDEINLGLYYSATNSWTDIASASVGDTHWLMYSYNNQGATVANQTFTMDFYLSTDHIISTEDTLLFSNNLSYLSAGSHGTYRSSFTVPSLPSGTYYVGCILDAANAVAESNEGNNVTFMEKTAELTIKDDSANASSGAFKFVNSWGTGTWQNKTGDGHYWTTYESMKTLQPTVYYYKNSFYPPYSPTIVAVFKLTHPYRDKTKITLAVASDMVSIAQKEFQSRSGDTLLSGALPYPENELALDISEFAQYIGTYDLYLAVENSDTTEGTLDSFRVEFSSRIDQGIIKTIVGSNGTFAGSNTTIFKVPTSGCLNGTELDQIQPQPRAVLRASDLTEESPGKDVLARDMARVGVYEAGRNYNERFDGFGTGFAPPTREEWAAMRKLRSVSAANVKGIAVGQSVDNSKTIYFPPIGNQGAEGSCSAFAFAYYVHTYTMAREYGWDLSQASFGGAYPGAPLSDQNRIMSPDFVYHQINSGVDEGSNIAQAGTILARIGCATWATMPYSDSDHSSWPTLDAYEAAAKYRASEANAGYWEYKTMGYFVIEGDAEINLLKSLLESGYCVVTSIRAGSKSTDDNIYHYLSPVDVISATSFSAGAASPTNHAQTIAGFKDGAAWDPLDPDS